MPADAGPPNRRRSPARRPGRSRPPPSPASAPAGPAAGRAGRGTSAPAATGGGGGSRRRSLPRPGPPPGPRLRSRRRSRRQPPPDRPRKSQPSLEGPEALVPTCSTRCWKGSARSPTRWPTSATEQERRRTRCPDVTAKTFFRPAPGQPAAEGARRSRAPAERQPRARAPQARLAQGRGRRRVRAHDPARL